MLAIEFAYNNVFNGVLLGDLKLNKYIRSDFQKYDSVSELKRRSVIKADVSLFHILQA